MISSSEEFPKWLEVLLKEKFFNACLDHEDVKKNEKNILCLDCCISLCPHCISSSHTSHRLLQIRRYVYHDVLRVDDGSKLMDCSLIQAYTTNSSKVVFINERPKSRHFRGSGNFCVTCDRSLQSPYCFCSLSCKISDVITRKKGLSGFLRVCKFLHLTEEGITTTTTPSSILELTESTTKTSSDSNEEDIGDRFWCQALACTATTDQVVRKKRSSLTCGRVVTVVSSTNNDEEVTTTTASFLNRRKIRITPPQRAPLY